MQSFNRLLHLISNIRYFTNSRNLKHYYYSLILLIFVTASAYGQSILPFKSKTINLTTTIINTSKNEGFIATDNKLFRVKIYTLSEAKVNETNHWFFRLLDKDEKELNYAQIRLSGYLKSNPNIKLNHAGRIVSLGSDGKYIIKSVELKQKGVWILKANIGNQGKHDTITYEIEVNH